MTNNIILASKSGIRKKILNQNGINCEVVPANVDEEIVKESLLKEKAANVLIEKYAGKQELADKVIKKSWVYIKRAHFHSQTMGIISIVFSLLVALLKFPPKLQFGISFFSGFGSLGYGFFWLSAALLAPGLGSTGAAKDSVELLAQGSAGPFFISCVGLFGFLIYKMFVKNVRVKIANL